MTQVSRLPAPHAVPLPEIRVVPTPRVPELYSTKNEDDIVDVRIIYNTFKNVLTPKQATNELFWTYLTHTTYWQYTRNRWSTAEMTPDAVKTRFFCGNNKNGKANRRGLLRNAIARLYWYGYLTHQDKPGKQYKLTEFMLSISDLCQNIMDRNYSMNRNITIGMLRAILEYCEQIGRDISEEEWRELCKYINRQGAVTLLDQMSEDEVADMTIRYLLEHRQKEQ